MTEPSFEPWSRMIAATLARQLTRANGGQDEDAPSVLDDDERTTDASYFTIDTPGGYMRITVEASPE